MPDATMSEACSNAQRALPGWYGKLPGAGDFADRRMPSTLAQSWERWFARAMASMRESAAQTFLNGYDPGPMWRFAIPAGAGAGWVQFGCIAPSRDRVGRRYPLLVAHMLDLDGFSRDMAAWASASLSAIGEVLAEAIQCARAPEEFDCALAQRMASVSGDGPGPVSRASGWPNLLEYFDPGGMTSFWWTGADERGSAKVEAHTGVLDSALFWKLFGDGERALRANG
ncbi:type VI secretion system-associated protein TagF [Trinickia sp. Y13]|uniref:type VI secretion system-associated protein TagF n=1 Tax=Trinickia sp. Y13 TaxID=2917807 RepID=UPI002405E935|nr:type VI secretion system-associated protein TagF [Trinickia sp. Y13]MDG0023203.1 type VI secretion system-associated protein TagF [Trinickia sp. Y13]